MTTHGDSLFEMQALLARWGRDPLRLDDGTVERLLSGAVTPDDAPPGYRRVAQVLRVVRGPAAERELRHEAGAVASIGAIVRCHQLTPRTSPTKSTHGAWRVMVVSAIGLGILFFGLAAAGALPGAAQDVAKEMLSNLGVSVPGPDSHAGTHPDGRGSSDAPDVSGAGAGATISDLARTTSATGVDKGAEISTAASDGHGQAGQHDSTTDTPPISVPNGGGTGTADTASKGHSTTGTGTAATASDGHSTAGSANANRP